MSIKLENKILKFQPNVLENVRKLYGFKNQEDIDKAVQVLDQWVKQQKHFNKKDFTPDYLERTIISCKGSVERAKLKIDRLCTFRTLMPQYFVETDYKTGFEDIHLNIHHALLPKTTKDHDRVFHLKNFGQKFSSTLFLNYFKAAFQMAEYMRLHDYSTSFILILDYTETNLKDLVAVINLVDMQNGLNICLEGYGVRVKGIHIISNSKLVDLVVSLFKQVLSKKIGDRIQTHKSPETLHAYISKEILPKEYGGEEKSLYKIHEEWMEALSSDDFKNYLRDTRKATTDENVRSKDTFNEQYMGVAGTFRTLTVD